LTGDAQNLPDDCVRLAMSGDDDPNQRLVQRWYGRVYALCQSKLRVQADAEDAAQETFLRGLARLHQLRSSDAAGAWLRGIAHNVCVDFIRRSQFRRTSNDDVANLPTDDDCGDSAQRDEQEFLIGLIHDLPQPFRETILLHYYEGMTYDEISIWLGVARSTVNERLSKARSLLKHELLSPRCPDEV
jgi:RNA polymerase sigma-70 factor (ECF subfamily)